MSLIYNIFPTSIYQSDKFNLNNKQQEYLSSKEIINNQNNLRSKDSFVLNNIIMQSFNDWIYKQINQYAFNYLKIKDNIEFCITQSWLNYSKQNQSHHRHYHDNSIISGIYYIQGKNTPTIFYIDNEKKFPLAFQYKEITDQNTETYYINNISKTLVLFPSYLHHDVAQNLNKEDRITLSFNTWVKGDIGSKDNLSFLKI